MTIPSLTKDVTAYKVSKFVSAAVPNTLTAYFQIITIISARSREDPPTLHMARIALKLITLKV